MSERSQPPPEAVLQSPKGKRNRAIFLWVSGVLLVLVLVGAAEVLLPFVLALLVAFILLPAVLRVQRLGVPRWGSVLIVYALTLGAFAGFVRIAVPSIAGETKALRTELPARIKFIQENWLPAIDKKLEQWSPPPEQTTSDDAKNGDAKNGDAKAEPKSDGRSAGDELDETVVPVETPPPPMVVTQRPDGAYEVNFGDHVQLRKVNDDVWRLEPQEKTESLSSARMVQKVFGRAARYIGDNAGELLKFGQLVVLAIWRGIFTLFMTLMLAAYMMLTHETIIRFFRDLVSPPSQSSFDRLLRRLERGLAGVVRGQLIICCVNGVLAAIGFWLFDLKYWPIMALLAGMGSIIPIFGSILATIPAVALGLTQSPGTALAVLAWTIGVHQLEANFLNPKIIGDAAKIHPVLVVFSLIVGEHFFQIKGALLAVPCLSIVQTIFLHFRERTMGLSDPNATQFPPSVTRPPIDEPPLDTPPLDTPPLDTPKIDKPPITPSPV